MNRPGKSPAAPFLNFDKLRALPSFSARLKSEFLSGLVPGEQLTKRMFDDEPLQKQHELMKAVGEINKKFGKDTVRFGSIKTEGRWKMKQTRKSQSYTTNWNELLVVN